MCEIGNYGNTTKVLTCKSDGVATQTPEAYSCVMAETNSDDPKIMSETTLLVSKAVLDYLDVAFNVHVQVMQIGAVLATMGFKVETYFVSDLEVYVALQVELYVCSAEAKVDVVVKNHPSLIDFSLDGKIITKVGNTKEICAPDFVFMVVPFSITPVFTQIREGMPHSIYAMSAEKENRIIAQVY